MHTSNPPCDISIGEEMYGWAKDLFPICRSITGDGVRQTLDYIKKILPELVIKSVPSGYKAFDWTVPDEWTIEDAFILDEDGNKLIDFKKNNLHVVGYSTPVDCWLSWDELNPHLHSIPEKPETIPYVTSYYSRNWGFCLTHRQKETLSCKKKLHVVINSKLKTGVLNYAEVVFPGKESSEVLFSTYICHPSLANNELSGPVVSAALARIIRNIENRRLTYRFIFIPETIGSIVYLSKNYEHLKKNTIAGFNLTCVGDDRSYSFLPSRNEKTLADQVAEFVLKTNKIDYNRYTFLTRGSDERQYCWPGIDLPVVSIMRSKYGTYPEYHTSDDNLDLITPKGLAESLFLHNECVNILEHNHVYVSTTLCEPNLGSRGLYPTLSSLNSKRFSRDLIDFMVYCDGKLSIIEIAEKLNTTSDEIIKIAEILIKNRLIARIAK